MKKIGIGKIVMALMMALTLGAVTSGVVSQAAWAEGEESSNQSFMTVSPMNQRIVLTPGEVYQGSIKVSNPASATGSLKYSATVGSFTQEMDENNQQDAIDTDTVTSYNQMMWWMKIDQETGEVAPNETKVIPFTITVPEDAPAGGQYATIIVKNDTQNEQETGNIMIQDQLQIASIIYAEVTGETRNEGEILNNTIPNFLLNNRLKATSLVENKGNVHTDAKYTLQVWPLFSDEEICTNEEDPSTGLVMPETKQYHVETCDLGIVGIYKARQTVSIFGETSIVDATVFVCPIWLILIILVIIVAIVVWIVSRVRARKKTSII